MTELLKAVASWPSLLLVLLLFGFAPGFCLRLLVLAYPSTDPRRRELIAELYVVPRLQRPLWVAEQFEVALFEGLAHRVAAATRWLKSGKQEGSTERTDSLEVLLAESARIRQTFEDEMDLLIESVAELRAETARLKGDATELREETQKMSGEVTVLCRGVHELRDHRQAE